MVLDLEAVACEWSLVFPYMDYFALILVMGLPNLPMSCYCKNKFCNVTTQTAMFVRCVGSGLLRFHHLSTPNLEIDGDA